MPRVTPPRPPAARKTFCEFFAGIGLVRQGLAAGGWDCVYANDIDPKKRRMYEAAFGPTDHFHEADIRDTAAVLDRVPGTPFLATASFPCVDLSLAGHYRGLRGGQSSAFFGFADVVQGLGNRRPQVVLIENVPGFVTSAGGRDFAAAAVTLSDLGYRLDAFVLDAERFVPQSRPRVFLIGVRPGSEPPIAAQQTPGGWLYDQWRYRIHSRPDVRPPPLVRLMERIELPMGWLAFDVPPLPTRVLQLADVIDLDDGQDWWDEQQVRRHRLMMSDLHWDWVAAREDDGGVHIGTIYRRVRQGKQRAEVRFDGVAGCLRTPRGGSAKQIVIVVAGGRVRMRWMTPREYARLQGAADFPLTGDRIRELFGFGDAVCVPVIRWIDRHILTPVFDASHPPPIKYARSSTNACPHRSRHPSSPSSPGCAGRNTTRIPN